MITGIQIIAIMFALFMIYLTFLNRKRKEFTIKEYLFWFLLWVIFILVSLFPEIIGNLIKDVMKLQRPLDFFIIVGFMYLIGALFYTYTIVRKTQQKTEEIVRKLALERAYRAKKEK